jgi:mRNA interferase MazF
MIWMIYVRGDIYRLKTSKHATGHEQRGSRYGIVMQSDAVMRSTVVVVPTSTSTIEDDTRVRLVFRGVETFALTEQMAAVDRSRLGEKVGRVDFQTIYEIEKAIRLLLGMY